MLSPFPTCKKVGDVERSRFMHPLTVRFADPLLEKRDQDARLPFRLSAYGLRLRSRSSIMRRG
jgi:hypothetical protein